MQTPFIEWDIAARSVLPFAAAHIFVVILIYFSLVKRSIGEAYPYLAVFICCFLVFLTSPLIKVTAPPEFSYWYDAAKYIVLTMIGLPALVNGTFVLAQKKMPRAFVFGTFILGAVWSLYYFIVRLKPFIVKSNNFQFLKQDFFKWDWLITLHSLFIIFVVLVPCLYLMSRKPNKITNISLYGVFLLCFSILMGNEYQTWVLMNLGCSLTALIWGWAVFSDIKQNNISLERHSKHESALAKAQFASAGETSFKNYYPAEQSLMFPYREREELIEVVRTSSNGLVIEKAEKLLDSLSGYTAKNQTVYIARVREALYMLVDAAIYAGADARVLTNRLASKGEEIKNHKDIDTIKQLFIDECVYLASILGKHEQQDLDTKYFNSIKTFVLANYFKDIGIVDIADGVGISRSHLMRIFKKVANKTINQYLVEVRIEKAHSLLLSKSVTDTAFSVGFNNSNYFATVFKKHTGVSPKQYQQQAKQLPES